MTLNLTEIIANAIAVWLAFCLIAATLFTFHLLAVVAYNLRRKWLPALYERILDEIDSLKWRYRYRTDAEFRAQVDADFEAREKLIATINTAFSELSQS